MGATLFDGNGDPVVEVKAKEKEKSGPGGEFEIRLKDGSNYGECVSTLQKLIRRGVESDAVVLAVGMYDSHYGSALARRIPVIAAEDIGLAQPEVVAQVCTLCSTWLTLKREMTKGHPDPLLLVMAVILLCRANKSREVDNCYVAVTEEAKKGGETIKSVLAKWAFVGVDSHTTAGKERLNAMAAKTGMSYKELSWEEFLTKGAVIYPHVEVQGDPWGRRAYAALGYDYDEMMKKNVKAREPGEDDF